MLHLGRVSVETKTYPIPAGASDNAGTNKMAYRCNNNLSQYSGNPLRGTLYPSGLPLLTYVATCP